MRAASSRYVGLWKELATARRASTVIFHKLPFRQGHRFVGAKGFGETSLDVIEKVGFAIRPVCRTCIEVSHRVWTRALGRRPGSPETLEKLRSMLLKRWVLLLDPCAALAAKFLTSMDPRPWPGARLSRNSRPLASDVALCDVVFGDCSAGRSAEAVFSVTGRIHHDPALVWRSYQVWTADGLQLSWRK
jgi:hypothetical protein